MKTLSKLILAAACLPGLALAPASAQNWPQKAVHFVVPFPAGGGTDFVARRVAKLQDKLGQTIVVENRGGANGAIGLQAVKQSQPDGYMLAFTSDTPMTVNPWLYNVQTLLQFVQAGKLKVLGVAEPRRIPEFPNYPAVAETVPGFEMAPWVGIVAPAGTPQAIIDKLSAATIAVLQDPAIAKQFTDQQLTVMALPKAEFGALIKADTDKWEKVVKAAGIKME